MKKNILIFCSIIVPILVFAQDVSIAPANPAFTSWQRSGGVNTVSNSDTTISANTPSKIMYSDNSAEDYDLMSDGNFGYIPSPVNRTHLTNGVELLSFEGNDLVRIGADARASTLPSKYDCRDDYGVTSVKNQAPYGSCWAFAAIASIEGNILKTEGKIRDFSENNMINLHGFEWGFNDGGNEDLSIAYLTRNNGPVAEVLDTYPSVGTSTNQLAVRQVQRVMFIPARTSYTDNDAIKQAVLDYGPLAITYYHNSNYFESTYNSYYYNDNSAYPNHYVTLIGWDDDFPASNFKNTPPGNGAFIIKNSYGKGWGEKGFFYISYYDNVLGFDSIISYQNAKKMDYFGRIYDYTPYGKVAAFGFNNSTEAEMANMFTAEASEKLGAVSFYSPVPNTQYTLKIYTNCQSGRPTSGNCVYNSSGTIPFAGYETIHLSQPVNITAGKLFSVYLYLNSPNYDSPMSIEFNYYSTYLNKSESKSGQSYYKHPQNFSWSDLYNTYGSYGANLCIKAFAIGSTTNSVVPVPYSWLDKYPTLLSANQNDYEKAANSVAANGLYVYENYLVGLDPTLADSKFTADIVFTNNVPQILWEPRLNPKVGQRQGLRWYTVYGKKHLDDEAWEIVTRGHEDEYNFYKVGVELP